MNVSINAGDARRTVGSLLTLLAIVSLIGSCQGSTAKDRGWSVQDPLWSALPQSSPQISAAQARAVAIAKALGIPGIPSAARRERDMQRGVDYDLIEFLSAAGDKTVVELDTETHAPISIVRLGPPDPTETAVLDAASAPGRARAIAEQLGLAIRDAAPDVRWQPGLEAWEVRWGRVLDGYPVIGDGAVVDLTVGGRFQALSVTMTRAAPAPASPIPPARAAGIASAFAAQRQLTRRPGFTKSDPALVWVRPNNFLNPSKSDAPEPILRLAYSVTFTYVTVTGEEPSQAVIWISAADGSLLGGSETA